MHKGNKILTPFMVSLYKVYYIISYVNIDRLPWGSLLLQVALDKLTDFQVDWGLLRKHGGVIFMTGL